MEQEKGLFRKLKKQWRKAGSRMGHAIITIIPSLILFLCLGVIGGASLVFFIYTRSVVAPVDITPPVLQQPNEKLLLSLLEEDELRVLRATTTSVLNTLQNPFVR